MNDYRRVRVLAIIPGSLREYQIGDVINLPFEDAESLVRQGYAVYADARTETGSLQPAERAVTVGRTLAETRRTV